MLVIAKIQRNESLGGKNKSNTAKRQVNIITTRYHKKATTLFASTRMNQS